MKHIARLLIILMLFVNTGCTTITSMIYYKTLHPFQGTRLNVSIINHAGEYRPLPGQVYVNPPTNLDKALSIADLPFSLVCDVLMLPASVIWGISNDCI